MPHPVDDSNRFRTPLTLAVRRIVLSGWLAAAAAGSAYAQPPTLTVNEAVRLALAGNRDLALAAQEVEKAALSVDASKTAKKPRFNVSFFEPVLFTHLDFRLGALGTLDLPHNFAFALGTATQPISQLYDIGLGIKAASLSKDLASERLRAARQTVVDEIKRAYYGILRAESGLKASREAVGLLTEAERLMDALVTERAALRADLLDVQTRRAKQEHDLLVLEDTMATGRERLNVALGRDPETPFALERVALALPAEVDLTAARATILDRRPDVRQTRITIDLAKTDWKLKKAEQMPHVGALFSYVGNINMPLLPGNIAAAVIQASWEPFDWGRKGYERATKQIAVRQAETMARQLEATVAVDLNARARALREARSLAAVTEMATQAAQERLRVMLDRRSEEALLAKDLLQAQVAVAEADHNYQAALLAYWEARADFEKAVAIEP
jgi:outer membrane protein TolC